MTEQQDPQTSQQSEQRAPEESTTPAPLSQSPLELRAAEARRWAVVVHLAAFAGYVIPFGNFIGPLLVWLMKREEFPEVDAHGKAALNFHITAAIAAFVFFLLIFVGIGLILLPLLGVLVLVEIVLNAVRASNGEEPRYHLSLTLIR